MKMTPTQTTSPHAPPLDRQPNPKTVRALGWVLMFIGPCLSIMMLVVAGSLFDTIYHLGRPAGLSRWHGGPAFTRLVFELFGAVFLLGIAIFAGGWYQVRAGRRHPVLVGIVLVLAAATAYLGFALISARTPVM